MIALPHPTDPQTSFAGGAVQPDLKVISLVFDGGCCGVSKQAYGSFAFLDANWDVIFPRREIMFGVLSTNNIGEWQTLASALEFALKLSAPQCGGTLHFLPSPHRMKLYVLGDSQLVIYGACKRWKVRAPHLKPIAERVWALAEKFPHIEFKWWARENSVRILGH